jgi:hypothetical protein
MTRKIIMDTMPGTAQGRIKMPRQNFTSLMPLARSSMAWNRPKIYDEKVASTAQIAVHTRIRAKVVPQILILKTLIKVSKPRHCTRFRGGIKFWL